MDIQKIFEKVKKSFPEVDAELIEESEATLPPGFTDFFMLGDPITGNVIYTQERVEQLSEEATEGIIAHELAHQIQAINTETNLTKRNL